MFFRIVLCMVSLCGIYFLGHAHCQNRVTTKQVEVIRYVKQQKVNILSRPNADKSELLELLRADKL